jgi:hypothetical protein
MVVAGLLLHPRDNVSLVADLAPTHSEREAGGEEFGKENQVGGDARQKLLELVKVLRHRAAEQISLAQCYTLFHSDKITQIFCNSSSVRLFVRTFAAHIFRI